jgi:hypothetical protein
MRFDLMAKMAKLPQDLVFFTQIEEVAKTPNSAATRSQHQGGGGRRAVTAEGLKSTGFNLFGEALADRPKEFRKAGIHSGLVHLRSAQ